jgi:hypothetical protein
MYQNMVTHFDRCNLDQLLRYLMPIFQTAVTVRTFKSLRYMFLAFSPQVRMAIVLVLLLKDS